MKVFVTGASGFVGSEVVRELLRAGHHVVGLARSEESAQTIRQAGAEVLMGDLEDLSALKKGASEADGVIHTGFIHDFANFAKSNEVEKTAINAMGEVLMGTKKPIVVTAGILGLPHINGVVTEESTLQIPLRTSEPAALALAEKGVHASVVRLAPSTHDKGDKGFMPFIIHQARTHGVSGFPGEGNNRWPGVHRKDAAKLFRLAVEKGAKGALYNAIDDNGIELKKIAELIGEKLNVPVKSLSEEETATHFQWMSHFISFDSPATNLQTQEVLGWKPTEIGLLEDLTKNYF
ncbi:SDR family oxidoreductase [Fluviicola sp.]|uniref:SDR family oxidoreductase n=1 Tax=Fluviicola sp. TaxID=1917219 RepID=UPI0031E36E10